MCSSVISQIEVLIANKATAQIGEGPHWDSKNKVLYWVDILGDTLHIYNPNTNQDTAINIGTHIGCIVPRVKGGFIAGVRNGIALIELNEEKTKVIKLELIHKPEFGRTPETRFNDGKCDPAGRFWAGTMDMQNPHTPAGNLYCIEKDLHITQKETNIFISNGLTWTADNKTFYFIDTNHQCVFAYDYNIETGAISNKRVAVQVDKSIGRPDGMTIDNEGMLWIATFEGGGVTRYNPHNGKLIMKVSLPVPNTTSVAFGGNNLDELYVTSARYKLTEEQVENYPLSGSLFVIKGLGVRGLPAHDFAG